MSEDIQVSVYCLTYNHEKYVRKTLEGFLMQKTDFKVQYIIHDDASTDNTANIIKEYAEKYPDKFILILQTENQYSKGVKIVKDFVLPVAKGKYIAVCEGDDYWTDENKLQLQYDALEAHPECSFSAHKVQYCNEDGSFNEKVKPSAEVGFNRDCILNQDEFADKIYKFSYIFQTSSYFFRREVLELPIDLVRDEGIMRKCLALGGVYYIDKAMSTYRLGSIYGFNSQLKKRGFEGRVKLYLSSMNNDIKFNEYTNCRYEHLIKPYLCHMLLRWGFYNPKLAKQYIKDCGLELTKIWKYLGINEGIKVTVKYALLYVWPRGLKMLNRHRIK